MKNILICAKLAQAGIKYLNDQPGLLHIETGLDEPLIRSDTNLTQKVLQVAKRSKLVGQVSVWIMSILSPLPSSVLLL